jgi:hypothetical protein
VLRRFERSHLRVAVEPGLRSGRPASVSRRTSPVKKIVLLLVVIALGAVIAKKVRSA